MESNPLIMLKVLSIREMAPVRPVSDLAECTTLEIYKTVWLETDTHVTITD